MPFPASEVASDRIAVQPGDISRRKRSARTRHSIISGGRDPAVPYAFLKKVDRRPYSDLGIGESQSLTNRLLVEPITTRLITALFQTMPYSGISAWGSSRAVISRCPSLRFSFSKTTLPAAAAAVSRFSTGGIELILREKLKKIKLTRGETTPETLPNAIGGKDRTGLRAVKT